MRATKRARRLFSRPQQRNWRLSAPTNWAQASSPRQSFVGIACTNASPSTKTGSVRSCCTASGNRHEQQASRNAPVHGGWCRFSFCAKKNCGRSEQKLTRETKKLLVLELCFLRALLFENTELDLVGTYRLAMRRSFHVDGRLVSIPCSGDGVPMRDTSLRRIPVCTSARIRSFHDSKP